MGKTNILVEHLKEVLEAVTDVKAYHNSAKKPSYPYVIFFFNTYGFNSILEINVWGKGSASKVNDIADKIEKELNRYTHLDDNMSLTLTQENRNDVSDPEEHLSRIRLTFFMQHYERSGS